MSWVQLDKDKNHAFKIALDHEPVTTWDYEELSVEEYREMHIKFIKGLVGVWRTPTGVSFYDKDRLTILDDSELNGRLCFERGRYYIAEGIKNEHQS